MEIGIPEQSQTPPDIKFIYTRHIPENFNQIWSESKDAYIILLEGVELSAETKKDIEDLINWAAKVPDQEVKDRSIDLLGKKEGSQDLMTMLTEKIINEGKEFHFVDTVANSQEEESYYTSQNEIRDAVESLYGGKPIDSYSHFKEWTLEMANNISARDLIVGKQIYDMVRSNKDVWRGKKLWSYKVRIIETLSTNIET